MNDICRICKINPQLRFSGNGAYNPYRGYCKECYDNAMDILGDE